MGWGVVNWLEVEGSEILVVEGEGVVTAELYCHGLAEKVLKIIGHLIFRLL